MKCNETFGQIRERAVNRCEYLTLAFSPLSAPLRSRWRNNGLSADFLGDYVITFLPTEDGIAAADPQKNEIRHAVTYIANELLENAMKYHEHGEDTPISIHMELTSDYIAVSANNGISDPQAQLYKKFIDYLLKEDPNDLLVKQLEENAKRGEATTGLGLITMITDYGAELGWRFEVHPERSETMTVTTSAVMALKNILGESK